MVTTYWLPLPGVAVHEPVAPAAPGMMVLKVTCGLRSRKLLIIFSPVAGRSKYQPDFKGRVTVEPVLVSEYVAVSVMGRPHAKADTVMLFVVVVTPPLVVVVVRAPACNRVRPVITLGVVLLSVVLSDWLSVVLPSSYTA